MSDLDKAAEVTAKLIEKGIIEEPKKAEPKVELAESVAVEPEVLAESVTHEDYSEVETEAMKKGWKPDGPKSADEFLRAEPLYEEIKQRGKEIKTLRSQVDELMKHVGNLKKAGYQDKLEMIKQERANAVARSDLASVDYLDEQLHNVKAELQQEEIQPHMHPAAVQFVEKYKDIIQDYSLEAQEIKNFIDSRDKQLAGFNLDPELHMSTLEKDMKMKFPHKFQTEAREPAISAVESDSRPVSAKRKAKYSFSDLSSDQKNIYKHLERRGVMSGADYIKQLIDLGELK